MGGADPGPASREAVYLLTRAAGCRWSSQTRHHWPGSGWSAGVGLWSVAGGAGSQAHLATQRGASTGLGTPQDRARGKLRVTGVVGPRTVHLGSGCSGSQRRGLTPLPSLPASVTQPRACGCTGLLPHRVPAVEAECHSSETVLCVCQAAFPQLGQHSEAAVGTFLWGRCQCVS